MDKRIHLVHIMTIPDSLLAFLRGQVQFVQSHGFRITGIATGGPGLDLFAQREGVPVHAVAMPRDMNLIGDIRAIWSLYRILRRIKPDIVQSGTPQGGLMGTIAATLARVPIRIYHIRGLPLMTASGPKRQLLRATESVACRLAHRVLCVSSSVRDVAIAEGICRADKIVVLCGGSGNGVDSAHRFNPAALAPETRMNVREAYGIPAEARVIGFVGRLHGIKGLSELARAWTALRNDYPDLHLLAAGEIEQHDPASPEALDLLRSDPRVHLVGHVDETAPLYSAMDILAFPTYREGLPNVLLEASAMELAIVATDVPGCTDVVADGETGTLVPVQDAEALAVAIRTYLEDSSLRIRHGRAARDRIVTQFQQEAIWQALVDEYHSLLAGRHWT